MARGGGQKGHLNPEFQQTNLFSFSKLPIARRLPGPCGSEEKSGASIRGHIMCGFGIDFTKSTGGLARSGGQEGLTSGFLARALQAPDLIEAGSVHAWWMD